MHSRTEPAQGRISQGLPMRPVSPNRLPTQHSNTPPQPKEARRQPALDRKATLNPTQKAELHPDLGAAVSLLWSDAWMLLRAAFPDVEARLAQLERQRPTRFRALARLEASAGRCAGRCLRGTASPADLQMRLERWRDAVLVEIDKTISKSAEAARDLAPTVTLVRARICGSAQICGERVVLGSIRIGAEVTLG